MPSDLVSWLASNTSEVAGVGESDSGTGPTIRDGQIIDFCFSRWTVINLPDRGEWKESRDEKDDVMLGCA